MGIHKVLLRLYRFQNWGICIVWIAALSAAGSIDPETPLEFEASSLPVWNDPDGKLESRLPLASGHEGIYALKPGADHPENAGELTVLNCANPPVIDNISGDGLSCANNMDGDVLIHVTGGTPFPGPYPYQFDWDWDATPQNDDFSCGCPSGEYEDLSGLGAGIYTVTVTDANGCTATASAPVTLPNSPDITGNAFDVQCFGEADGTIEIDVTGGTPNPFSGNYDFDWSNDGTGDHDDPEDLSGIGPGTYTVIVTDFLGCTAEATFTINEPTELNSSVTAEAVQCAGESTGTIDLTVSGGTTPYTFDWNHDGTGDNDDPQNLQDLPAGTYAVTVTDANGCTTVASVILNEPAHAVEASVTGFDAQCFGEASGNVDLTVSGGTGSYTFSWSNGAGTEDLQNVPAGSYTVVVTDANGCTATANFTVNEPPELTGQYTEQVCAGGTVMLNGTVYDETNPSGTEVFTSAGGCDSTVTITLTFDPPATGEELYTGCSGDAYSVVVNGSVYDESNPSGTELITTAEGCDSIVTVNLTFQSASTGEETYAGCTGDGYSVVVNGTTYHESNPSGTETLTNANGCDSVVTVTLTFNQPTTSEITNDACTGDGYSVTVNGTIYNESNPSGVEVISNANGCDSTITIDLFFGTPSSSDVTYTGCQGDGYSVVVNGTTYDESNPSGVEVTTNADGCDSTITVALNFLSPITEEINYSGCFGDGYSVVVNGTTYDETNPTGQETLTGGNGCDSIIIINLVFSDQSAGEESYAGCTGDGYSVVVNGTTYNEGNPSGQETLVANSGCDSVVTINLAFAQPSSSTLEYTGCSGDGYTVTVNGIVYSEANPDGTEVIQNAAGCDSTITIDLVFNEPTSEEILYEGCAGDGYAITVNGTVYNEGNPSGTEVMPNAAGCDSTITINLVFQPVNTTEINYAGCVGDGYSINVNGTIYDETNTTGTEFLTTPSGCDSIVEINLSFASEIYTLLDTAICSGGAITIGGIVFDVSNTNGMVTFVAGGGCDSIVEVQLSFLPVPEGYETYHGCSGDGYSVFVGGTVYDETNPTGTELIVSPEGCDSIVVVDLVFGDNIVTEIDSLMCPGQSVVVNGIIYDENNQTGTEVIPGAGCDSVVIVNLFFTMQDTSYVEYEGCFGDGYSVVVNGTAYDETNPEGTELLSSQTGCDSVVIVTLSFIMQDTSYVGYEGCTGDGYSVIVNGTAYDEANPAGTELMSSQSGCDSIVVIDLVFHASSEEVINYQGCVGDNYSLEVNGTVYDALNPSGTEIMSNQFGCDSVIHVSLSFGDTIVHHISYLGCIGDGYSVDVGGQVFDETNPVGEVFFPSNTGCDSIVVVSLLYQAPVVTVVNEELCQGDSMTINGTVYHAANPQGTEVMQGAMCDSIVEVTLTFIEAFTDTISYTGCMGDGYEVVVDTIVFSESNPTGQVVLVSSSGCDSTVVVDLSFENCCQPEEQVIQATICAGGSYDFNGMMLDQPGAYADSLLNTAGCDSVVILELQVADFPEVEASVDGMITCTSAEVMLTGITTAGAQVHWEGPGIDPAQGSTLTLMTSSPGWHYLYAVSGHGCQSLDSVLVEQHEDVPVISVCDDLALDCAHDSVVLNVEVSGAHCMIEWIGPGMPGGMGYDTNVVVNTPGVYTVMALDTISECASPVDTVLVYDHTREVEAEIDGDEILTCQRASAMLNCYSSTTGAHIEYTWMNWEGKLLGHQMELEVNEPGKYFLHVMDKESMCADMDSTIVADNKNFPVAAIGDVDHLDCRNESVIVEAMQAPGNENVVYTWQGPENAFLSSRFEPAVEVMKSGMYYLIVKDTLSFCFEEDSVFVEEFREIPVIDAGQDQQLTCLQVLADLGSAINPQSSDYLYAWSGPGVPAGAANQYGIQVDQEGMYHLSVTNLLNGCEADDSVYVAISGPIESALVEFQDLTCSGTNDGMIIIEEVFGGTAPFTYQLNGQPASPAGVYTDLAPGNYHVQITDQNGCTWESEIPIEDGIELSIDVGPDLILDYGDTYQLAPELLLSNGYIDSIVWSPQEFLSCSNCLNPVLTGLGNQAVSVTVYTEFGCSASDALNLQIEESYEVYIPNVFTPNGDGKNDYFTLFGDDNVKVINKLEIFNRWGDKVFSRSNLHPGDTDMGWDGRFNGEIVNSSVYVYVFEVELHNGLKETYKGDVTLLR